MVRDWKRCAAFSAAGARSTCAQRAQHAACSSSTDITSAPTRFTSHPLPLAAGAGPEGGQLHLCWRSQLLLRVADPPTCGGLVLASRTFSEAWGGVRARWAAVNAAPYALIELARRGDLSTIRQVWEARLHGAAGGGGGEEEGHGGGEDGGGADLHADEDAVLRIAAMRGDADMAAFVIRAGGTPQVCRGFGARR